LRHSPRISFLTFRIISFGSGPTTASLTASVTVLLLPPNILPNIIACVKQDAAAACEMQLHFQLTGAVFNASRRDLLRGQHGPRQEQP
jgi:hypothetical protein